MKFLNVKFELNNDLMLRIFLFLCAVSVILVSSDAAFAAADENDIVGFTLCRLVKNMTGGTAKGIATIAIFSVCVMMLMGKANTTLVIITAIGVGTIFAAPKLVGFLSGDSTNADCPTS